MTPTPTTFIETGEENSLADTVAIVPIVLTREETEVTTIHEAFKPVAKVFS